MASLRASRIPIQSVTSIPWAMQAEHQHKRWIVLFSISVAALPVARSISAAAIEAWILDITLSQSLCVAEHPNST
eukprot:3869430-Amphidinium_carterae.1